MLVGHLGVTSKRKIDYSDGEIVTGTSISAGRRTSRSGNWTPLRARRQSALRYSVSCESNSRDRYPTSLHQTEHWRPRSIQAFDAPKNRPLRSATCSDARSDCHRAKPSAVRASRRSAKSAPRLCQNSPVASKMTPTGAQSDAGVRTKYNYSTRTRPNPEVRERAFRHPRPQG